MATNVPVAKHAEYDSVHVVVRSNYAVLLIAGFNMTAQTANVMEYHSMQIPNYKHFSTSQNQKDQNYSNVKEKTCAISMVLTKKLPQLVENGWSVCTIRII